MKLRSHTTRSPNASTATASTRRTSLRLRSAVLTTAALVIAACVVQATPANALTLTQGVNLRPCVDLANVNCAPVGTTGATTATKMRCWRDGSWATGTYRSNRWFLVLLSDGREGYVHSSYVGNQVASPRCDTLPYVRAADFAISQIGQTRAPENWSYNYSTWSPGPFREWSGDCAKFAHMAYAYAAGTSYPRADAIGQYRSFKSAGKIYSGLPRYGAPVFYDIARPYGHTAIYIGGRTIVTTQGMDNANLPVVRRDIGSFANYLGWAAA